MSWWRRAPAREAGKPREFRGVLVTVPVCGPGGPRMGVCIESQTMANGAWLSVEQASDLRDDLDRFLVHVADQHTEFYVFSRGFSPAMDLPEGER